MTAAVTLLDGRDELRLTVVLGQRRPIYRAGTHCPSCDGAHWLLGRASAECAACGDVLPLAPEARRQ
ncbi:hypothetical protein P1X14_16670 [Sphingomonas sp. AOB5]|uniref:hypothetical protein n=1 Tax=Sphingomonas sp. AOB5 TaxID=3034017 RepID=UPI0023F81329|nr:hypothetical protein [Sphingomonas sp. AOB5]MDF7776893.1 hypothetical protein [Sphingomonas sp. AOB5]